MSDTHRLPDGQFMGHTVRRTQHLAPDRNFTSIPVERAGGVRWRTAADARAGNNYNAPPHEQRSMSPHAVPARPVPMIMTEPAPAYLIDRGIEDALCNTIDGVCAGPDKALASYVRDLKGAKYVPDHPDGPLGSATSRGFAQQDMFERETVALGEADDGTSWVLDVRIDTGACIVGDEERLGVYLHGVANPMVDATIARALAPGEMLEDAYILRHRGQREPTSLYFDMFVPVEPAAVTHAIGWGRELEALLKAKGDNLKAPAPNVASPQWVEPAAVTHARCKQAEALREARDQELCQRIRVASDARGRAERVLCRFAWRAVLVAIVECKQLTVEKR